MNSKLRPFLASIVCICWLLMLMSVASDRVASAIGYTAGVLIIPFALVYFGMRSSVSAPWAYSFLLAWLLTVPITLYFGEGNMRGTTAGLVGGTLATAFAVYFLGQKHVQPSERKP